MSENSGKTDHVRRSGENSLYLEPEDVKPHVKLEDVDEDIICLESVGVGKLSKIF